MVKVEILPERERGVCCAVELEVPPVRATELADVLKALSDPTRLQMVLALRASKDPVCICDFTVTFDLSQPTLSHHIGHVRSVAAHAVASHGQAARRGTRRGDPTGDLGLLPPQAASPHTRPKDHRRPV